MKRVFYVGLALTNYYLKKYNAAPSIVTDMVGWRYLLLSFATIGLAVLSLDSNFAISLGELMAKLLV